MLDKLFSLRYGNGLGDRHWQFPDDDAGLADLKILLHHLKLPALPRTIARYAPWADSEAIIQEIEACPKRYTAKTLGRLLNLSGYEWRQYGIRTITPVDMTEEEMKDFIRVRREGQRLKRRRSKGVKPRQEYEGMSLSKIKPWVAEGISRRTWERRRKRDASLVQVKLLTTGSDLRQAPQSSPDSLVVTAPQVPTSPHALPDLQQSADFNPILSWMCLRAVYHQEMNKLCDEIASLGEAA
jgi:hypothetical protein